MCLWALLLLVVIGAFAAREVVMEWRERDPKRIVKTHSELSIFAGKLHAWMIVYSRIPGPNLCDAVDAVMATPLGDLHVVCPMVLKGLDPWGRPIVYEVSDEEKKPVLRSYGPNGIDEHGGGDDIQVEVEVPSSLKEQES